MYHPLPLKTGISDAQIQESRKKSEILKSKPVEFFGIPERRHGYGLYMSDPKMVGIVNNYLQFKNTYEGILW